jgi:hypothetical protein
MLAGDAPDILKASMKQLRNKSLKTRTGILHLLKELLATLPDGQIRDTDQLLPGVLAAINVSFRAGAAPFTFVIMFQRGFSVLFRDCWSFTTVQFEILLLAPAVLTVRRFHVFNAQPCVALCRIRAAAAHSYASRPCSSWGLPSQAAALRCGRSM